MAEAFPPSDIQKTEEEKIETSVLSPDPKSVETGDGSEKEVLSTPGTPSRSAVAPANAGKSEVPEEVKEQGALELSSPEQPTASAMATPEEGASPESKMPVKKKKESGGMKRSLSKIKGFAGELLKKISPRKPDKVALTGSDPEDSSYEPPKPPAAETPESERKCVFDDITPTMTYEVTGFRVTETFSLSPSAVRDRKESIASCDTGAHIPHLPSDDEPVEDIEMGESSNKQGTE